MTWRDDGYVEALQQETLILAKRVMAARSRLLLSTCFDISPTLHADEDRLLDPEAVQDKDFFQGVFVDSDNAEDWEEEGNESLAGDPSNLPRPIREYCHWGLGLDDELSVISEEGMVEEDDNDEREGHEEVEDEDDEDKSMVIREGQCGKDDESVLRAQEDISQDHDVLLTSEMERCSLPGEGESSDEIRRRRLGSSPRGMPVASRSNISENLKEEDWRRLKESFIL